MKFPMLNISHENWDPSDDFLIYILENQYIYTNDNHFVNRYYLNNHFVDSKGDIYRFTKVKPPQQVWRRILSFLPNVYKARFVLEPMNKKMDIETVRIHMLKQLNKLPIDSNVNEWINAVRSAKTYEDVIFS
jgi:hypothetical protein